MTDDELPDRVPSYLTVEPMYVKLRMVNFCKTYAEFP